MNGRYDRAVWVECARCDATLTSHDPDEVEDFHRRHRHEVTWGQTGPRRKRGGLVVTE